MVRCHDWLLLKGLVLTRNAAIEFLVHEGEASEMLRMGQNRNDLPMHRQQGYSYSVIKCLTALGAIATIR